AYKYTDIINTTASQTSDKTLLAKEDNQEFVLVLKINDINKNAGSGQLAPVSKLTLVKTADAEDAEIEEAPLGTTYEYDFTKDTVNTVGNTVLLPYLNEYDAKGTVPGSDTTYDITGRNWHFLKFSNDSKWVEQKLWTVGFYLQSTAVNEWAAFKIRVPKSGAYSVTLDNYTNAAYKNGEMFIVPSDASEADYTNSAYKYTDIVKTTPSQTSDKLLIAGEDNQEFVLVFKITEVGMLAPPAKLTLVKTLYKTSYDFTKDTVNTVGSAVPLQYFTDYDVVGTVPATHASLAGNTYNMVGRNWHFLKLSNDSKWQEPWLWTVGLYLVATAPNEWIAIKIRVPKAGTYSVTLDNATAAGYKNGEMYILPSDASEANYLSSAFKYTDIINTTPSQTSDKTLRVSKSNEEFVVVFKLNEINKNAGAGQLPPPAKLTLNEIEVKPTLTHITADFGTVTVGDVLAPVVKWFSEGKKLNGADGVISTEIIEGENDTLLKGDNGNLYAIAEGEGKVRVTGTLEEVSQSVEVTITVKASKPDAGLRDIQMVLSDSELGTGEITSVASISAKNPSGKNFDLSNAYISFSVPEESKEVIELCDDGKSFKALQNGDAEIEAMIIANGAINKARAAVSVNDEIKVKRVYLYTSEEVSADTKIQFTIRTELNNGEILSIGEIVGFEIVNESTSGVLDVSDDGISVTAAKEGTAEIKARVRVRGIEHETDTIEVMVSGNPVQYPANFSIDFRNGTYEGDNYGYVDEIKEYTSARNWIFYDYVGGYPNERPWLASKTAKYTQFTFKKACEGYFVFKVKFPSSGIYKIDSVSSDNSRAAKLELYIVPVTKENEKNLASKLVNTNDYYVGSADYYTEGYTPLKEDRFHSYGNANIPEVGEYFVVFKNVKGQANSLVSSYGDALYPLYFTFTSETAMNNAELLAEGDKTELELNDTVKIIPKLYNAKGDPIDYTPESITSIQYVSSDANVASVTQDGVVTGLNEGKATITATISRDGTVAKAGIDINVKDSSGINVEHGITA
ncbi:MAG: Ig-like domain-containing protein, partial [Oscillospiraceae bacterium]|nr:Ig-like domain-containing protein [Oscillospiraceae bacterium]